MRHTLAFQIADEDEQKKLDAEEHPRLMATRKKNLAAFQHYYPELFEQIIQRQVQKKTVFVNKLQQLNIVDLKTGQAVYDLEADGAQYEHALGFSQKPVHVHLQQGQQSPKTRFRQKHGVVCGVFDDAVSNSIKPVDTLIALGLGLGGSLGELCIGESASAQTYKNIIVYEPDWDMFLASLMGCDWQAIIESLTQRGANLVLLIGHDDFDFIRDFTFFEEQLGLADFHLYRHLHYPILDKLYDTLVAGKTDAVSLQGLLQGSIEYQLPEHDTPLFSPLPEALLSHSGDQINAAEKAFKRYKENVRAFAKYYPDIADAMEHYTPQNWQLMVMANGQLNVFHKARECLWYAADPDSDVDAGMMDFDKRPVYTMPSNNLSGGKLSHYTHYQYSGKIAEKLTEFGITRTRAPREISSLILVSPGLSLHLERLFAEHEISYLYLIEPNIDLFYWSLFTVSWRDILHRVDAEKKVLTLNIGDRGENFVTDLRASIAQANGYLLFNSFMFIPRIIHSLQRPIADFRESIQNILSLSENFNYAQFSLSHTYANFTGDRSWSVTDVDTNASDEYQETPVFVVGNGPSLDNDIDYLKANRDKVILVSCGTALKALWANGLRPDFHTEVEQNRCTHQVISALGDAEYLAQIDLVAPTWVHPDTVNLFRRHLAMYTAGAGAMRFYHTMCAARGWVYRDLKFASPTVSNFALSAILELGFHNIYLFGVDLGFKSIEHHHSKHSAYYNNKLGGELYSYKKAVTREIPVRGNFTRIVSTKAEFALARKCITQLLGCYPAAQVVNCSDGAFIEGTMAHRSSDIQLGQAINRDAVVQQLLEHCFSQARPRELADLFSLNFNQALVVKLLRQFRQELDIEELSYDSVKQAIARQKELLLNSYNQGHVVFYGLLISTAHYVHAVLLKCCYSQASTEQDMLLLREVLSLMAEYIDACIEEFDAEPLKLDASSSEVFANA